MGAHILGNTINLGPYTNIVIPDKNGYSIINPSGIAIGNLTNTNAFSSGTVMFGGNNLTVHTSLEGGNQYVWLSVPPHDAAINSLYAGNNISLSTSGANTTVSVIGLDNYAVSWHSHDSQYLPLANSTIYQYTSNNSLLLAVSQSSNFIAESNSSLYQSAGGYLTTAAASNHTHGTVAGTNITIGSSSNGLALSVGNYLTTAARSTHIHGAISSSSITGSNLEYTSASNGLTLGIPAWLTTAAAGGNNLSLGGNTSGTLTLISSGTATIAGGNNITLSQDGNGITIIGAAAGTGGAGTGFSSTSISGVNIAGTLDAAGLNIAIPSYLTTAMASNAGSNFVGFNTAITNGSMTVNSSGISINIADASVTASNAVYGGDYISLSTNGVNTTVSVIDLQATSNMSLYQLIANSSLSLGTDAANSFLNTAFSTLLQHTSDNSLSLAVSQSSLFQAVSNSSLSLGTNYTSHIHSDYLNSSNSSAYQSSVLSNTFALSSHTHDYVANSHTHGSVYVVGGIGATSASSGLSLSVPNYLTTAAQTNHTHGSVNLSLSNISGSYSSASNGLTLSLTGSTHDHPYVNVSNTGNVLFVNSLGSNITWSSSVSASSTYIYATAGGDTNTSNGGVAIKGSGTNIQSTGTVEFANSNGLSFGLTGGTMTGSYTVPQGSIYFVSGSNVTWGSSTSGNNTSIMLTAGGGTGGGNVTFYAGGNSNTSNSLYFENSNNVIFGLNGVTLTASISSRNLYFNDGNGVTWGSSEIGNSTTITASVNTITNVPWSTASTSGANIDISTGSTNTLYYPIFAASDHVHTEYIAQEMSTVSISGSNVSLSANDMGITMSVPNYITGGILSAIQSEYTYFDTDAVADATSVSNLSGKYLRFDHRNLYTTNTNSIGFSLLDGSESVQLYLTHNLAGVSHTHGNVSFNLSNATANYTSASNGLTIGLTAGGGTGGAADGYNIIAAGSQTANTTGTVILSNSNGLSFGMSNSSIITGSYTVPQGSVYFNNSNGVTFGSSTSGSSTTITGSVATNYMQIGNMFFVNSNGHTFSSSTNGASSYYWIVT